MIRHLSPNAIRHLRRLSRSTPRCMTRCLIRHRCAILRHRLSSHGLRCDGCMLFEPPNACKVVEGEISPSAWCQLFVKKT
jgi:hypothetical protein